MLACLRHRDLAHTLGHAMNASISAIRNSRLTSWLGLTYLLLFLFGPWAHDHASHEDASRVHHVHTFAAGEGSSDAAEPAASSLPHNDPDGTGAEPSHRVDAHDGQLHVDLQLDRPGVLPGLLRILPGESVARIEILFAEPPSATLGSEPCAHATSPASSGQLALHQGTDVSPPGA